MNATTGTEIRVIKTETQYRDYLDEVERLASLDPNPSSKEGARLELLAALVEHYESERFASPLVSPVDAILFRIEEGGLQQKHLIPYLGSKSRVSEILAGKRQLTVDMIRKLNEGLGIPVAALVGANEAASPVEEGQNLKDLPFKELIARGIFRESEAARGTEFLAQKFLQKLNGLGVGAAYLRWKLHSSTASVSDARSLQVWLSMLLIRSRSLPIERGNYKPPGDVSAALRELAWISGFNNGPILAREYLAKKGIALVVEPRLKKIPLDGAALLDNDGTPIIGLTLRYDRLDSFWFTLMHEAAHVFKHLQSKQEAFVDDSEKGSDDDRKEAEANRMARDAFIPRAIWAKSDVLANRDEDTILALANDLHISPAIVAGRLRKEYGYNAHTKLIGNGEVRKLFVSEFPAKTVW